MIFIADVLSARITTRPSAFLLNAGSTVNLECAIHATQYRMFDYPVFWIKVQRTDEASKPEECQVCCALQCAR